MAYKNYRPKPVGGFYPQTKVYNDGSHYIAIPHTEKPYKPRRKVIEEYVEIKEPQYEMQTISALSCDNALVSHTEISENQTEQQQLIGKTENIKDKNKATRKQLFEKFYKELIFLRKRERREKLIECMCPYFNDRHSAELFVDNNLDRKRRNIICRRIRLTRKANLQNFNYFVTFTYDSKLHTEESFRKKLKNTLGHFCSRKDWKYIGVWERSPEKKRLHFHGIFDIPDGTMPGVLLPFSDYSLRLHRKQTTIQNTYFNEHFGRSDFETIDDRKTLGNALAYLMKYLEKTGEKIVYSKGLPQYFISDIFTDDVVCNIGLEDSKLLLYDNFTCWDEGCNVGTVSKDTIKQLRKSN